MLTLAMAIPTHGPPPPRQVIFQFDAKGAAALWQMEIHGAKASLMAAGLVNWKPGQHSKMEKKLAARLIAKARSGVVARCADASDNQLPGEVRIQEKGDAKLVAHGLFPLSVRKTKCRFMLSVPKGQGALGYTISLRDGWQSAEASDSKAPVGSQSLPKNILSGRIEAGQTSQFILHRRP